jgi:hypothetical protein
MQIITYVQVLAELFLKRKMTSLLAVLNLCKNCNNKNKKASEILKNQHGRSFLVETYLILFQLYIC